jgi:hypothetical protein
MRDFSAWIKLYRKHIVSAIDAIHDAKKYNIKLSLYEKFDLMRWISYSRFKKHYHKIVNF